MDMLHDLAGELTAAILSGQPHQPIYTPGFAAHWTSAADVINDGFAGEGGTLPELLQILAYATKSTDAGVREPARAWLAKVAAEHAAYHYADALALAEEAA